MNCITLFAVIVKCDRYHDDTLGTLYNGKENF